MSEPKEENIFYFNLSKSYLKPKLSKAGSVEFYARKNKRIRYFQTTCKETIKYLIKRGEQPIPAEQVEAEVEALEEAVRNKPRHQKYVTIKT